LGAIVVAPQFISPTLEFLFFDMRFVTFVSVAAPGWCSSPGVGRDVIWG
jgi:hypothetical protein